MAERIRPKISITLEEESLKVKTRVFLTELRQIRLLTLVISTLVAGVVLFLSINLKPVNYFGDTGYLFGWPCPYYQCIVHGGNVYHSIFWDSLFLSLAVDLSLIGFVALLNEWAWRIFEHRT